MAFSRKLRNYGIFIKVLIIFLLVILPLFGSIFYLNKKAENDAYASLVLSMQDKAANFRGSLDTEFDRIGSLQEGFINNQDLQTLTLSVGFMSAYEKFAALNRVQFNLQQMKNANRYIRSARVYLPSIDRMLQASLKYGPIDPDEYKAFTAGDRARGFVFYDNGLYMSNLLPFRTSADRRQATAVVVELDLQAIQDEMDALAPDGGAVLVDDEGGWQLTGRNVNVADNELKLLIQSGTGQDAGDRRPFRVSLGGTPYLALRDHSDAYDFALYTFVPEREAMGALAPYNRWFQSLAAASVVIIVFFSFWIYRVVHTPLSRLVRAFRRIEVGQLDVHVNHRGQDEFAYLYVQFNEMTGRLKRAIEEIYEQKLSVQQAELKQLQAQINPHFLYNTYFIMNQMVRTKDYDSLEPFSRHLGQYLQFITRNMQEELPLEQEAAFMNAYAEIQSIRFMGRIACEIGEVPERFRTLMVPRLLLQPIVENAYKHGLERKPGGGWLSVAFADAGDRLSIVIEDNGGIAPAQLDKLRNALMDAGAAGEITGLVNVNRRIRLKFGGRSGLSVARGEAGGLRVTIDIATDGGIADV